MNNRLGNVPTQPVGAARYAAPDGRSSKNQSNETSQHHDITTLSAPEDVGRLTLSLSPEARAKVKHLRNLLRHVRRPVPTKHGIRRMRPTETSIIEQIIMSFDIERADDLYKSRETDSEKLA